MPNTDLQQSPSSSSGSTTKNDIEAQPACQPSTSPNGRFKGAEKLKRIRNWPKKSLKPASEKRHGESFKSRLESFTWNWFTIVMATGGIADVLYDIPYTFRGLKTIGKIVMILDMALFLLTSICITTRFLTHKGSFKKSFREPAESLFIPASVVSIGILLTTFAQYGIPSTGKWFQTTFQVLFWIYAALAFCSSCGIYLILWSTQEFDLPSMTPIWVFPVYPLLIVAPLASALIKAIPTQTDTLQISSQTIIVAAVTLQGIGFLISFIIYSAFIYRLMTHGLPAPNLAPSMFVSVGPSGFTATGVIEFGSLAAKAIPVTIVGNGSAVSTITRVLAYAVGLCIWGLALWFFVISVAGQWRCLTSKVSFDVSFWAFVFPNSGLVRATQSVGNAFGCQAVNILGTVFAGLLVLTWLVVSWKTVWAIWKKKLL